MKVAEDTNFNEQYPEHYPWGKIDSYLMCNTTNDIINHLNHDMKTVNRNLVPGLRKALCIIAQYAEL